MPQPLQADQVVDVLPDHTGDGDVRHEPHHEDAFPRHWSCLTMTAGFPATTTFSGTLLVTTAPAATTEFSPMVTPLRMTAFMAIHTLSRMITGAVFSTGRGGRAL